jgi:Tol biopolymer transport system component
MRSRTALGRVAAVGVAALTVALPAAAVEPGPTQIVSVSELGVPGDEESYPYDLSADGRFIAFGSAASTLAPGDTNGTRDVFVRDLSHGTVERVSVGEAGAQLPGNSGGASMSADGRLVVFTHTQLVETPSGSRLEETVYLHDRVQGASRQVVATTPAGAPAPFTVHDLSGNGRFLAVTTAHPLVRGDDNGDSDVYRLELATGRARLVTTGRRDPGHRQCRFASISHSGRFVTFEFPARLVRRDRLNARDIYVRDLDTRRLELVTLSSSGVQANRGSMGPSISAGGRYVVFSSAATNLVRKDTNDDWDVFLHDRKQDTTERVSVNGLGRQGNGQSQGPGFWFEAASVSRDGRYVAFGSFATSLDPSTDNGVRRNVFVRDREERSTRALSVAPDGSGANDDSGGVMVSDDGSAATFWSDATNLTDGDANGFADAFLRRLGD